MIFRCLSTGSWKKFWGQCCGFTQRTSFLTSIRSLQNYTISRLLQACYLCTSIRKLITKTCWINLVLYLLFFTETKELKQPSRVIIRQRSKLCMQKRTTRKSSKTVLYYNNISSTHRLVLPGGIETNPGMVNPDNQKTKPKSNRLQSSTCQLCNKIVWIISKRMMSIH